MKGLDQKLGELITEMTPQALKQYRQKTQSGMAQETLVNIAESCVRDFPSATSRKITRHNGSQGPIDEASRLRSESDDLIMEAISRRDPNFAKATASVKDAADSVSSLSESQRKEFEFCKMVGMSEADSLKAARL